MNTKDIKRRFLRSLMRGTGEAYLLAMNNPKIDFSDIIVKGAVKNFAYDGQCESSRAQYIYDLMSISSSFEKIRLAVLNAISTEKEDSWSLTHLFDLAMILAKNGDVEAKQAIYNRFFTNSCEGADWIGYSEILELDDVEGLLYIADKIGRSLEVNPDDIQDDSIISHFQDEHPDIDPWELLKTAADSNRFIQLYLDNVKQTIDLRASYSQEAMKSESTIDELLNNPSYLVFKWYKKLSKKEIKSIAEHLMNEKDKSKIEKLLSLFSYIKFPFNSDFILELAMGKYPGRNRISEIAIRALENLKSDNIRQFALEKINKTKRPEEYLGILKSNYKKGDYKLLAEIALKTNKQYVLEELIGNYIDIYTLYKTPECKMPLEALYDKHTCGVCRYHLVKILIKNNVLSERIGNEIKYDSYLETRLLNKT